MPFEPRVYSGDNYSGDDPFPGEGAGRDDERASAYIAGADELSLPDDLAELADQLSLDADHLADCYPAGQKFCTEPSTALADLAGQCHPLGTEIAASAPPRLRVNFSAPVARRWLAAAAVLAVGLGLWGLNHRPASPDQPTSAPLASIVVAQPESASSTVTTDNVASHPVNGRGHVQASPATSVSMPPVLFQELSGPEQEAVLDLLETDGNRQGSFEI